MRFMVIRRAGGGSEKAGFPPPQLAAAVPAGRWLHPSARGARLHCRGGAWSIEEGPFPEDELVAGFALIDVPSREAALDWARAWPRADGEGNVELEVRLAGCPGECTGFDTGAAPRLTPWVVLLKSDAAAEADFAPPPEVIARMNERNAAAVQAGVALAGEGLRATAQGARVRFKKGAERPAVIDGPFTEIKELIAGFWLIQTATRQEAIAWVHAYPFPCLPDLTVELRELALPARA